MKLTNVVLGGVAIASLMGAGPALAFTHHPGTPAEHQQTEDLNQQQLQQAQSEMSSAAAASADQTSPSSSMANQTSPSSSMATDQTGQAGMAKTANNMMPLDSVSNPPQTLANASVETSNGQAVGAVQRVITDAAGKAKTVVVALLGKASHLVAIAANQLTFDQSRDVVVAQLSADEIQSLPMAPQT
ncbi:MAG TPA: hypothetical protein VHE09_06030 [Rhizomicrobium sp.]|nr:hypothetical protein [Rhizomicrobium sp.]